MKTIIPAAHVDRLIKAPEVLGMTSISRPHLYSLMKRGQFVKPVKTGIRGVAWRLSDVQAWISSRTSTN